jgi:hypothetical protein
VSNHGRGPNTGGLDHAQYAELKREQCRLPNFGFIHPGFGFRPRHLFNQRPAGQFFEHGINPLNLRTIPRCGGQQLAPHSPPLWAVSREQVRQPPRLRLHSRSRQPHSGGGSGELFEPLGDFASGRTENRQPMAMLRAA